jgi:hypothetical protein
MDPLRKLIHARPLFVLFILAMALCVKAAVPSGYMIFASSKTITVGLCTDGMGAPQTMTVTIPMDPASNSDPQHKSKADGPCAFSVLSMGAMGGADAPLLALALAFVLALAFFSHAALPRAVASRLLPPSRGPPASA